MTEDRDKWRKYIHGVANPRIDGVLAGAPRTVQITASVERCCACYHQPTRKFDRGLGQILHDQLRWLDVPDRVLFKPAVTVHQCLNTARRKSFSYRSRVSANV